MFLIDDVLLAPMHGLLWVFGRIREAAQEEMAGEADAVTAELRELYMLLETGRLTETEFEARERVLLDRLDAIRERDAGAGDGDEETDEGGANGEHDEDGDDDGCEKDEEREEEEE